MDEVTYSSVPARLSGLLKLQTLNTLTTFTLLSHGVEHQDPSNLTNLFLLV